jgi:hypothetical protein
MKTTFVISAFPGCGKSYCFNNYNGRDIKILDSDSSEFSWVKDSEGNNTKERNPEFPNNYIKHIKENIGKVDIIFVSSHEVVRNALLENDIRFLLVYPYKHCKEEWVERFKARGNDEKFIKFISDNWDNFIDDMDAIDSEQGKYSVGGLIYHKIRKERLDNKQYIYSKYLYFLTDNSMGNLSCLWATN